MIKTEEFTSYEWPMTSRRSYQYLKDHKYDEISDTSLISVKVRSGYSAQDLWPNIWAATWKNQQSALAKTKAQISFAVTAKLISAFVFATRIVQFLLYLTPEFQASSSFLWLYSLIGVGPVRKPHCRFSHEMAKHLMTEDTWKLCKLKLRSIRWSRLF